MGFLRTHTAVSFVSFCLIFCIASSVHADSLTGGAYTIDGGPTAISSSTNQSGGTYSAATTATPAGGYVSGGTFSGGGTSPVIGFTAASGGSPASGAGGAGGIFTPTPVVIESVVTTPTEVGATVTVTFSTPVDARLLYTAGDTTHISEASPSARVHTFTLHNLTKGTTYPFSFSARSTASAIIGTTVSFGGFSFATHTKKNTKTSVMQGQIFDDAGKPLNGANVQALRVAPESDAAALTTTTDEQGRYAFAITSGGTYALNYDAAGYRAAVAQVNYVDDSTESAVVLTRDSVADDVLALQCVAPLSWAALIALMGMLGLFCYMSYIKGAPHIYVLMSASLFLLSVIYSFLPCALQQSLTSVVL
jgi:5-hydroxyisourate hydrolase-like protein (transthyretin family)